MKLQISLAFVSLCAIGAASITPIPAFAAPASMTENYDTIAAGSHSSINVFASSQASRIGSGGALLIGDLGPPMSKPHTMFGRGVNVQFYIKPPMTYFGGYFKVAPAGVNVTKAKFIFYGSNNAVLGSSVVPINGAWKWIGFRTSAPYYKVVVEGNGSLPGYVMFDNSRIKP